MLPKTSVLSTTSIFYDVFRVKEDKKKDKYFQKVIDFVKDTNTKSNALLAYWGAETIIDALVAITFFMSGSYLLAFLAFMLATYRTYAIFGVLSNVKHA
jgi:hypothetical protein